MIRINFWTIATSYGTGPFHPAIRNGSKVMYWPNVTKATEDEAYDFAALALKDAYDAAAMVANQWNIHEV